MTIAVRSLTVSDFYVLKNVADGVFDDPLVPSSAKSFLKNQDNYLVVAVDEDNADRVVGFASAVKYLHPDKEKPEMVVLEIGVAPPYRQQGAGKKIMNAMLAEAKKSGCKVAWLATEPDNVAALALYKAAGGKPPETCIHIDFDLD
ncbi:MAG: GNAT family N-acetyltransferase [Marinicaulis sp.]|nr:GNAT family N-acetyltransferase [Marinicaulis sp.]